MESDVTELQTLIFAIVFGICVISAIVMGISPPTEWEWPGRLIHWISLHIPSVAYRRLGEPFPNIYMRLNEFKKIYAINPDAYQLYLIMVYRYYGSKDYIIGFKGIDFYRYKRWRKKVLKIDSSDNYDETYREFMTTAVQKDIDKLAKKAQKEIDRGRKEMLKAMESSGELKL